MICKNCGNYNDDEVKFCAVCGASMSETDENSKTIPYNPVQTVNYYPGNSPVNTTVNDTGSDYSMASMILGIVAVLSSSYPVVVLCALVSIFFGIISIKKRRGGYNAAGIALSIISLVNLFVVYLNQ